jgi:hypothetical protein
MRRFEKNGVLIGLATSQNSFMKIDWTVFNGRQYTGGSSRDAVRVTLHRKGMFYLNLRAFEALGSPTAVELRFNDTGRILGMKATDPTRKNAFRLKDHGTGSKSSSKRISAAALFHHFRFQVDRTVQFQDVDLDNDEVMILDLDRTVTVGRGIR